MTVVEKLLSTGRALDSFSYHLVYIYCKKVQCHSCPHGPYWYARYRQGNKIKSIYVGRVLPDELVPLVHE